MARSAWRITKVHDTDCQDEVGVSGPSGMEDSDLEGVTLYPFRMKDDDGVLVYEGVTNHYGSFRPLDDFGMPNYGCTVIEYRDNETSGPWSIL